MHVYIPAVKAGMRLDISKNWYGETGPFIHVGRGPTSWQASIGGRLGYILLLLIWNE